MTAANDSNRALADKIHNLFLVAVKKGNYTVGNHFKLSAVKCGWPNIGLVRPYGEPTSLEDFIDDLWSVLQEHYAAVDFTKLRVYSGDPPPDVAVQPSPDIQGKERPRYTPIRYKRVEPAPSESRVLDTHGALLDRFENYDAQIARPLRDEGVQELDKTLDQFIGLRHLVYV